MKDLDFGRSHADGAGELGTEAENVKTVRAVHRRRVGVKRPRILRPATLNVIVLVCRLDGSTERRRVPCGSRGQRHPPVRCRPRASSISSARTTPSAPTMERSPRASTRQR